MTQVEKVNIAGAESDYRRKLLELVRDVLPGAIAQGDRDRVVELERHLALGNIAIPNTVSPVWNSRGDVPRNEVQVREIFAHKMDQFGYRVAASQEAFPDWCLQDLNTKEFVFAEVEHRSSSFYTHGHDFEGCDMIVCWEHDFPATPLPVLELVTGQTHSPSNGQAHRNETKYLKGFAAYATMRLKPQKEKAGDHNKMMEWASVVVFLVDSEMENGKSKTEAVSEVADHVDYARSTIWAILSKREEFGL